jgi:hypothetical protein
LFAVRCDDIVSYSLKGVSYNLKCSEVFANVILKRAGTIFSQFLLPNAQNLVAGAVAANLAHGDK